MKLVLGAFFYLSLNLICALGLSVCIICLRFMFMTLLLLDIILRSLLSKLI